MSQDNECEKVLALIREAAKMPFDKWPWRNREEDYRAVCLHTTGCMECLDVYNKEYLLPRAQDIDKALPRLKKKLH